MAMCWPKTRPCYKCAPNSASKCRIWDRTSSASYSISKRRQLAPLQNLDRGPAAPRSSRKTWRQPGRSAARASRTGPVRLLRLDTPGLDDPGPLCGLVGDELAEIGGRAREHHPAHVGEPLHDLGIGEACVGFPVEGIHDRGGRILRRGDAEPGARLVARYEIADGRDVRQRLR